MHDREPWAEDAPTIPMRRIAGAIPVAPDSVAPQTIIVAPEPPSSPEPLELDAPAPTFIVGRPRRDARSPRFAFALGALFVLSAASPWIGSAAQDAMTGGASQHAFGATPPARSTRIVEMHALSRASAD
jgi:hypothetical protein